MNRINKTMDIWIWPLTAVLIFLALQFISQFIVDTVGFDATMNKGMEEVDRMAKVAPWTMLLSSLSTALILCFIKPFKLFKEFRVWICDNWNALFAFIIFLLALVATTILNELVESVFGVEMKRNIKDLFEAVVRTPVGVIAVVFIGPICEEVVFRAGMMKPMLDRNINPWIPIVTSSVIFGLVHFNMTQMINAICLGFVFAIIYYRTRSIIITTIAHILNNAATVALMLAYPDTYDQLKLETYMGKGPMIAAFVIVLILLVVLIMYFWKNTEQYVSEFKNKNSVHPVKFIN